MKKPVGYFNKKYNNGKRGKATKWDFGEDFEKTRKGAKTNYDEYKQKILAESKRKERPFFCCAGAICHGIEVPKSGKRCQLYDISEAKNGICTTCCQEAANWLFLPHVSPLIENLVNDDSTLKRGELVDVTHSIENPSWFRGVFSGFYNGMFYVTQAWSDGREPEITTWEYCSKIEE